MSFVSTTRALLPLALSLALGGTVAATERPAPLIVRASPLVAPCVEASASAYAARAVRIDASAGQNAADVLVAADVEVTRALEAGMALLDSDVDLARIPWVLQVPAGNPSRIAGLEDALARGLEVVLPKDPAAYEARRITAGRGDRVREASDPRELRSAPIALLPLSLAGAGDRIPTALRPLQVRAVVLAGSKQAEAARAFASFLGSEPGQRAFTACGDKR